MSSAPKLPVHNPSTGELLTNLTCDTLDSATAKIEKAHTFFQQRDKHLPRHQRIDLLEKLHHALSTQKEAFLHTMVAEGGKPIQDSRIEFHRALEGIKLAIQTISQHTGAHIPLGYQASSAGRIANTQTFPVGPVLAFSAFNHPLNLIVHQVVPAFASGCPCIVKPAPDTPLSCIKFVELMHQVGIPKEYIQTVITQDNALAEQLVKSEHIAFFSFIGSAKIGWKLRSLLQPGVRCALEHGGIAPCIVSEHADIDLAVKAISKGAFYHAGQVCVSTQRVYVNQTIVETFVQALKKEAEQLVTGNANEESSQVGPLIRNKEVDRIHTWVEQAIKEGASCISGGNKIAENYYQPSILLNPSPTSKVSTEEIFGPVVCIYTYDDFGNATRQCNNANFAFQAAIFSTDINEITQAYEQIDASTIIVNDHTAFRDDIMPFAGLKQSGLGVGGIPYTIADMQYEKMLILK